MLSTDMDNLPDQILWEVLERITNTSDRNSVSLSCRRFLRLDNEQRRSLSVGCGLNPANDALTALCNRFPNLVKIQIAYSGWMSKLGKQLDDQGLKVLSTSCPSLEDLTLSYCTFITDTGISTLASCSKLSSLKLDFTPRLTGCGILSVVVGCKKLTVLHLLRCLNISGDKWVEYLGNLQTIQYLVIKNCRAIGEGDLIKLGPSWVNLKHLQFEVDDNYRYMKLYDRLAVDTWREQCFPCENLLELHLVNCIINPGRGLACVLGKCRNLERVHLDMCVGLRDDDIIELSKKSRVLRSVFLRVPSDYSMPLLMSNPLRLTDESLKALAENCLTLESVKISFSNGEFPSLSSFTLDGILNLIRSCPVRELSLGHVYCFNDVGMEALAGAGFLETLEFTGCQEITDEGLMVLGRCLSLRVLRLSRCLGVTDDGFRTLVGSYKLEFLGVEDCPQISERGVQGVARLVSFRQDLSWMY